MRIGALVSLLFSLSLSSLLAFSRFSPFLTYCQLFSFVLLTSPRLASPFLTFFSSPSHLSSPLSSRIVNCPRIFFSPLLAFPHFSSFLILPHFFSPLLTSPHLNSPLLTCPHLTSPHLFLLLLTITPALLSSSIYFLFSSLPGKKIVSRWTFKIMYSLHRYIRIVVFFLDFSSNVFSSTNNWPAWPLAERLFRQHEFGRNGRVFLTKQTLCRIERSRCHVSRKKLYTLAAVLQKNGIYLI